MKKIIRNIIANNKIITFKSGIIVIFIAFIYYLPFVRLGLDLGDEGYVLYNAKRIFLGEVPYRDFLWQYSPGQIIILSLLFKVFSLQVIVGRYYTLALYLAILACQLYILKLYSTPQKLSVIFVFVTLSFGLPLMNIPNSVLPAVFFSFVALVIFTKYYKSNTYFWLFLLGLSAGFILFFKQSVGLYYYLFLNILIVFSTTQRGIKKRFTDIFLFNVSFLTITLAWVYPLFLQDNISGFNEFIKFSSTFGSSYLFTYPPISMILTPFGFLKLVPYYIPMIFSLYLLCLAAFQKLRPIVTVPLLFALVGFFGTIYPVSDLLHIYPYYSFVLLGCAILLIHRNHIATVVVLILVNVCIGMYLTFFSGHMRYDRPFKYQKYSLNVEQGAGILTYESKEKGTEQLVNFFEDSRRKKEYILVYPFAPMIYFLLDNPNISKDSIFHPEMYSMIKENIHEELRGRQYYIVTVGNPDHGTSFSHFIMKQKIVFTSEFYTVYEVE